ncbi:MAG: 30S ribosomal protein S12 methylthiotransferase RimO [Angustibacter sp.]
MTAVTEPAPATADTGRSVALVTLGCTRNDVDSEELAGRLRSAGWSVVADADAADVAVVNTCGFIESAKKDSIDALLEASELREDPAARTRAVVAVGCLAQRYGRDLAQSLPETDAVLGFDSYTQLSDHLGEVLAGRPPAAHVPSDRRTLLPLTPVARPAQRGSIAVPGHGDLGTALLGASSLGEGEPGASGPGANELGAGPASGPPIFRHRLDGAPWAPLKIASGCDRRCAFCAIPSFRGAFTSRPPAEILAEARWLVEQGVQEVLLVSENSTSYGKDFGQLRALEDLLPELAAISGLERVRVSYLQPAEIRPTLLQVLTQTPGVVPYFDISFQHAAPALLRRMRRFGDRESFLGLIQQIRHSVPEAGIRSNFILGFPGENEADVDELREFLIAARLDVVGIFGYSDEDGTEGETLSGKLPAAVIAERVQAITDVAEQLTTQRAELRVGTRVRVLVEELAESAVVGRADHQGPDIDGDTTVELGADFGPSTPQVGEFLWATVVENQGVDLIARPDPLLE